MSEAKRIDAAEGLFAETPDGPRLLGSRCAQCRSAYFPRSEICHNPDCNRSEMEDATFGPDGTLWSIALQNYPPPPPALCEDPYSPYAVGLVDMPDGLRVLGRLLSDDLDSLEVGAAVRLVLAPIGRAKTGEQVISWQFEPAP